MAKVATYLLCLTLLGCITADQRLQASEAYLEKQAIAEATVPKINASYCEPVPGSPKIELNDISDIGIKSNDDWDATFEKIESHIKKISFAKNLERNQISCWSGGGFILVDVDELKDLNMTWLRIISGTYYQGRTHKCAYADDPNAWTIKECPMKGSVG